MFFKKIKNQLEVNEIIIDKMIREMAELKTCMEMLEERMLRLCTKLSDVDSNIDNYKKVGVLLSDLASDTPNKDKRKYSKKKKVE